MKRFFSLVMLATLAVASSSVAHAQSKMTSSTYGAGPHGYDWQIGTWSCTNSIPSKAGGPRSQTLTVTRGNASNTLFYRTTATNFDVTSYSVYVPSTKTWLSPFIVGDGTYGRESTTQTGKKIVWTGSVVGGDSSTTTPIRDTIGISATKTTDLGEVQSAGSWKPLYNITCTKT